MKVSRDQKIRDLAAYTLLAAAILLGGASRLHELRLAMVELIAVAVAIVSIVALRRESDWAGTRFAFSILIAAACLPLIQLIPLPAGIWTSIPGREELALALTLIERSPGWAPLSLTPDRTWRSFLALLPPIAMFLVTLGSGPASRTKLAQGLILAAAAAVLLGTAQFAVGGTRLYLWPTTDAGSVAGFFANRNHLATLVLVSIPFVTVLGVSSLRHGRPDRTQLWLTLLYIGLAAVALALIRSRAGLVLFGPALGGSLLAAWVAAGRGKPSPILMGLLGGAALVTAAVAVFAGAPLIDRFDTNASPEGRFENWPVVLEAATKFLPVGSGFGSFDSVYRSVEPLGRLDATYFNQAHNDYLETWLEAGWLGAALIAAFLIWYVRRSFTAWTSTASTQRNLQRAASVAIGVMLAHSAVDYPLRTVTLATIFGLCCGILELAARADGDLNPPRSAQGRRRRAS